MLGERGPQRGLFEADTMLTKGLDYWFLEKRLYQKKLRQLATAA